MVSGRVALDTNLVVLLVVGLTGKSLIARHKRLQDYRIEDYDLLQTILGDFDEIVFTPNVLTESSNLLRQTKDPDRSAIAARFAEVIAVTPEVFVPSAIACRHHDFIRFGLTDVALFEACRQGAVLLTVDLELDLMVLASRLPSINFNNRRKFP